MNSTYPRDPTILLDVTIEPDPAGVPQPTVTPTGYPVATTNGFAIASLVLGIVGLTGFPFIPSLLALIFGYKGKHEIDASGGVQQGRGLAVAGIVLGWIGTIFIIVIGLLLALVFVFNISRSGFNFGP